MKKNALYLFFLILILGTWWQLKNQEQREQRDLKSNRHRRVFQNFDREDICFIEMEFPGQRLRLFKQDQDWFLKPYNLPAQPLYVPMLLQSVSELTYGDLVSSTVEDHYKYKLDAKSKLVILRDCNRIEKARVYIGKPGENYRTAFFRLGDDPRVFHTVTDLFPVTTRASWLNRKIWQVPESAVQHIEIHRGNENLTFAKSQETWMTADGQSVPLALINRLLVLESPGVMALEKSLEKDKPIGTLTLKTGPVKMELVFFSINNELFAIRPEMPRHAFRFQSDFLQNIFEETSGLVTDQ